MATNLLETLQGLVTPQLLAASSSRLGESESAISKGLTAAFPLILGGLAKKANDPTLMSQIMSLLGSSADSSDHPASLLHAESTGSGLSDLGNRLLALIFGTHSGSAVNALADYTGLRNTSAASVMTLASSLLASTLGDKARRDGWNATTLSSQLSGQRDSIARALPAALSSVAGLGALRDAGARVTVAARNAERQGAMGWLWGLAAALVIALGGWWLLGDRQTREISAPASDEVRVAQDAARRAAQAAGDAPRRMADAANNAAQASADAAQQARQAAGNAARNVGQAASDAAQDGRIALAKLGAFTTRRLPTNIDLSVPEHGVESSVIAYLDDPSKQLDPAVWFNFDRLLFETGSATLKPESHEQLKNLAEILKAYPNVKVKIGGYTDNTGDAAANLKLSQDRAANVRNAIVAQGIAPDRLSAEGYGQQFPVADNTTVEGRQQNRRIALRVTEK